jgi:HemY protein
MIRALFYLLQLAILVALGVWLAENPGSVRIDWQGWRIETSFAILAAGVGLVALVAALVYRFWNALTRAPRQWVIARRERRRRRGYAALTQGMVAVAAGDADEAQRQARRADVLLGEPPLTMLLSAQAAQLNGDEQAAERYFTAMLERPETDFLGLRGLLMQAERRGDRARALELAERAHRLRPRTPWVLQTLYRLQLEAEAWAPAEQTLADARRHAGMDEAEARRHQAVINLQMAEAEAAQDPDGAIKRAQKALDLAPELSPAAVLLARLHARAGRQRKAERLVEEAWAQGPTRDLAQAYGRIWPDETALAQVKRFERLASHSPGHPESLFAQAEAALSAELWGNARRDLLRVLEIAPSSRAYRMLARLEESEKADREAARAWLDRGTEAPAEAGWVCRSCGAEATRWTARCGHCGQFDGLRWGQPPRVGPLGAGPLVAASAAGAISAPEPSSSHPSR